MTRASRVVLALAALSLPSCAATIFYDFSGTEVFPSYTLQFHYTSSAFITTDTFIPASTLDSCSTTPALPCFGVNLLPSGPDSVQHFPEISFQVTNPDHSLGTFFFYFPLGSSFATTGTIAAMGGAGTLVISSSVPEPTTGLLLTGGLAIVAFCPRLRYRKRNKRAAISKRQSLGAC